MDGDLNPDDTSLITRVDYAYDAYGNRIQERYAGDVSTPL